MLPSTRGNIYDRNGELLAYNELAYSVTIEDNGSYDSLKEKNQSINEEIASVLKVLDKNHDVIQNDFNIALNADGTYAFTVEGKTLLRFLADVYGHNKTDELKYNKKLGYNEAEATPDRSFPIFAGKRDLRYPRIPTQGKICTASWSSAMQCRKTAIRNTSRQQSQRM